MSENGVPYSKDGFSQMMTLLLWVLPILWIRQDGHFYFFLPFLLSKKVRNATIKLPKEISKPIIPININMISAAVISRTSLPMYSGEPVIGSGGYHPVMGTFRNSDFIRFRQKFQSSDFIYILIPILSTFPIIFAVFPLLTYHTLYDNVTNIRSINTCKT